MKKISLLFTCILFCSLSTFGQNNNPFGNSRMDRMPNNSMPSKISPEAIEKNKTQRIDKVMTNLKTDLKLDDLQMIAIRNEIVTNSKNVDIIMKKEISDDDKSKEINSMLERTEVKINSYLNKEQKEKYKVLSAQKSGKKDKKNKKESPKDALLPEEE